MLAFCLTLFTIVGGALLSVVAFALAVYSVYIMVVDSSFKDGLIGIFISALCTPFGLPAIAGDIINMIENLSDNLKDWSNKNPKKKTKTTKK